MVRYAVLIAVLILACPAGAFSHSHVEMQFGARVGIPFNISMESRLTGVAGGISSQAYDRYPFSAGPTYTALFYDRVAVELDSLYKPIRGRGGAFSPTLPTTSSTHGSSWGFPLVADYQLVKFPVH